MTREDMMALIIEHMENQGIEDYEQFEEYCQDLLTMSNDELEQQLAIVEELAIYGSTMPRCCN